MQFKLKQIRQQKKLSQLQLSKKANMARSYISEIEDGKYNPSVTVVCRLCKALDCTPNDLIDCEGDEYEQV